MDIRSDPVLARFRAALATAYGDRLERAVLFGSRARHDARDDSDYDVAVFIVEPVRFAQEARILADIETSILLETGAVINALPLGVNAPAEPTALMEEICRDGIEL